MSKDQFKLWVNLERRITAAQPEPARDSPGCFGSVASAVLAIILLILLATSCASGNKLYKSDPKHFKKDKPKNGIH